MKIFHLLIGLSVGLLFAGVGLLTPFAPAAIAAAFLDPVESPQLSGLLFLLIVASLVAVRLLQPSPADRFASPLTGRPELTSLA